jgi:hypothetical protein
VAVGVVQQHCAFDCVVVGSGDGIQVVCMSRFAWPVGEYWGTKLDDSKLSAAINNASYVTVA